MTEAIKPEVLVVYAATASDATGAEHTAKACAREEGHGRWQVWLELAPVAGGPTVRTHVETTQPDREAATRWACGLSRVYLDGALARASASPDAAETLRAMMTDAETEPRIEEREGVIDPIEVIASGERHLRCRLGALSMAHLRDVAIAQRTLAPSALQRSTKGELVSAIVSQTRSRCALTSAPTSNARLVR